MDTKNLRSFLDAEGRLMTWPAKAKKQMLALVMLAKTLEWDRQYSEQEINELLSRHHTFGDAALLRRELFMKHFVDRKSDGSAYWKTPRLLPRQWRTERLIIRDARQEDLPELQVVYDECAYIEDLTGYCDDTPDPILAEFRGQLLPPNGKKELHRLQPILEAKTEAIIGYLISYHGFPDPGTFWIASLAIRPTYQRQRFGKELIHGLTSDVENLGTYDRMGICVGVGNEPAMHFWSDSGFTEVIKNVDRGRHKDEWRVKMLS